MTRAKAVRSMKEPRISIITDHLSWSAPMFSGAPSSPRKFTVIVADPAVTPVTRPLLLTEATDELLLDHVTTRPVSVLPAESFVTAESCWVEPV